MYDPEKILKKLCLKSRVFFTDRGNTSSKLALKYAKSLNYKKVYIQDQGGWITYKQFAKKLKFELEYLETDYGLIKDLNIKNCVLLINSMPGYFALQDMKFMSEYCKNNNCFLINDVSGSIGTSESKYGDIILGSFGRWKPINIEYGGFIAYDFETGFFSKNFNKELKEFQSQLRKKLKNLPKRLSKFHLIASKIKRQLHAYEIIHRDSMGLNVVVKFENPNQELELIDFCKYHGYEFVVCPKYIRVMADAISIEIKRI
jgi:hypothetical protein